jgi:hypothetical protein
MQMTLHAQSPVLGIASFHPAKPASLKSPRLSGEASGSSLAPPSTFERIVQLVQSNDRLFTERDALLAKLEQARGYLADPDSNRNFAQAYLNHLRLKHSSVVARLRANRLEARQILARLDAEPTEAI